jgi:peptidoglycan/LPS O-acetylase OafA/YrhL
VYLGEISYSTYMICVPWKIIFVNAAARGLNLTDEKLPLWVWLIFITALVPLSAASYHLIEKPARERMKLMADSWLEIATRCRSLMLKRLFSFGREMVIPSLPVTGETS